MKIQVTATHTGGVDRFDTVTFAEGDVKIDATGLLTIKKDGNIVGAFPAGQWVRLQRLED